MDPIVTPRRSVCLNMIVKNEAAIIERCLRAAAPAIDAWVICDTGSTDDTPERIERFFRERGIPGELHRFPFVNFGQARNEALTRALASTLPFDYLLFADADMELVVDDPGFRERLGGPAYLLRQQNVISYVNTRILRRDVPARYVGVTHEYLETAEPALPLPGLWFIDHAAGSNRAGKFDRDAKLLEDALRDDPTNARCTFYLAQSWRDGGHLEKARDAYRRRAAMGGWEEEVWYSLDQVARLTERLGGTAAEVRSAYLDAFQCRPRRAEPLVALARWHRERKEWALAWLFARAARAIPRPDERLFLDEATYRWRADDEAAIAAFYVGEPLESFALCWALLDGDRLPEAERARVEANRDFAAPAVLALTGSYPGEIVRRLAGENRSPQGPGVTLTVTTCKRLDLFEKTINSFLNCCRDVDRIDRFVCIDDNSSPADRARMQELYPFFEFVLKGAEDRGHARSMNLLLDTVATPYWLHLEDDFHFLVTTDYVARAISILECEPEIAQVSFNRNNAETLDGRKLVGGILRRHPQTGLRYVLHEYVPPGPAQVDFFRRFPAGSLSNAWWPHFSLRPALMRTASIRGIGRFDEAPGHFERAFAERYSAAGLRAAYFDAVVYVHIGRLISERGTGKLNAYELNQVEQF